MEMTLVLLITSVIAAAATPIITSAVSDNAAKGGPDSPEFAANPWKSATMYNGGGIYNTPINLNSLIAVNIKPGAYASTYQYPSLLVATYATGNIVRNPQIIVEPLKYIIGGNSITNGTYASLTSALKIGMDEYENIMMASGSFTGTSDSTSIGHKNIYIGSSIQGETPDNKKNAGNSVFLGNYVNGYYASYAVNVGQNIYRFLPEQDTINIGSNLYAYHGSYSSIENVNIGTKANAYGMGRYNVIIGNNAGYASNLMNSIVVGNYAGNGMTADYYKNYNNIIIGGYALNRPSNNSKTFSNNIVIGRYSGYRSNSTFSNDYFYNNILLGTASGRINNNGSSNNGVFINSIAIGNVAGMYSNNTGFNRNNSIMIGYFAGANSYSSINSIFIGTQAGGLSKSSDSIYIGYYAGSVTDDLSASNYSNIAIGYYAGRGSHGFNNMYLGYYAGYNAHGNFNVGIGKYACKELSSGASKKWCLGYGTIDSNLVKDGTSTNIWSKSNSNAQMVIGFTDVSPASQNVVLYANNLYRWGATTMDKVSDRRFKENIVPSNRSIKDIRNINIYEYNFKADKDKAKRIGVIAQEYRKVFPNDVVRDSVTKKLALSVDWMIYTMVNAIKDVDNEIKHLQNDAKVYINDFSDLKTKISKLEKQAQQIKSENEEIKLHLTEVNKKLK